MWLAFVLLYSWPALWNGGPFFFPDSSHYIRAADAAMVSLADTPSDWSDRLVVSHHPAPPAGEPASAAASPPEIRSTRTVLTGRSIYYGALLYAGLQLFGKYGPVFLQAGLAVTAIWLFLFGAAASQEPRRRARWIAGGLLAVGLLSPLPFFVSRLMPDAFTGLLAIAVVSLLLFRDRYGRAGRFFLLLLAAAAITFHTSHILVTVAIGAGALLLNLARKERWIRLVALPAGLILFAAIAQIAFSVAVTRTLGAPPISPPFMSARLIADGPGYRYLRAHCGDKPFALCDYLNRMPRGSDILLWSENPRDGVFSTVPDPVKRVLGSEDKRFYLAVLREQPLEVLGSIVRSTAAQAGAFDLDHFNYVADHRQGARQHLPPRVFAWVERSAAYRGTMPVTPTIALTIAATAISLLLLAAACLSPAWRREWRSPAAAAAILLILAVAANIAICGALSTPHARYLMRIIWLLPLAVAALGAAGLVPHKTQSPLSPETARP